MALLPEERDRLVKAETRVDDLQSQVNSLRSDLNSQVLAIRNDHIAAFKEINGKLDTISTQLAQGRGVWWAVAKGGAFISAVLALFIAGWAAFK